MRTLRLISRDIDNAHSMAAALFFAQAMPMIRSSCALSMRCFDGDVS
jgi:hypothetical protein